MKFHIVRTYKYHALLYKVWSSGWPAAGDLGFNNVLTISYAIHVPVAVSAKILRLTNPFRLVKPPTKKKYFGVVLYVLTFACCDFGGGSKWLRTTIELFLFSPVYDFRDGYHKFRRKAPRHPIWGAIIDGWRDKNFSVGFGFYCLECITYRRKTVTLFQ